MKGLILFMENSHSNSKALTLTYIALSAALIAVCSWISIPTIVPFTLQTFAVCLISALLGAKRGTLAVIVYICLGAVGFPVFANFSGGLGSLFGTTGGYIFGFIFTALIVGAAVQKLGHKLYVIALSMLIGIAVCYAFGTAWFMFVYTSQTGAVGLVTVLGWCVFPFIIPDLIKIAVATILVNRLHRFIK